VTAETPPPAVTDRKSIVASTDHGLAAGQLISLDDELRWLRDYVADYRASHPEQFDKILRGTRLIMQMVLAQHRIGGGEMEQTLEAFQRVVEEMEEAFGKPPEEDV
jgi:hypothetical protein